MEFANFAMVAMPGHRSGPGAYANHPGQARSPIFAPTRRQARNSSPGVIFENIFLPPSGLRLTSNSQTAQFDRALLG
jgi:hypothetical protein